MEKLTKLEIVQDIIADVDQELLDEDIIHLVLGKTVSQRTAGEKKPTLGQRAADKLAKSAGSWAFIGSFALFLAVWITANVILFKKSFDPFPFILLNLILSCLAAIQAPVIMMSQNRQEEKDRQRAENDYMVNLKTEIIIQDLHNKLDRVLANQERALGGEPGLTDMVRAAEDAAVEAAEQAIEETAAAAADRREEGEREL